MLGSFSHANTMELDGKIVLVTGAGRGIGKALALGSTRRKLDDPGAAEAADVNVAGSVGGEALRKERVAGAAREQRHARSPCALGRKDLRKPAVMPFQRRQHIVQLP